MTTPSETTSTAPDVPPSASAADGRRILIASVLAAGSTFAITVLAARTLDPEANRQFIVFWSVLFGAFGILSGIQHESTRASATTARRTGLAGRGTRVLVSALPLGAATGAVLLLSSPLWAGSRLPHDTTAAIVVIALACVAYACHVALAGTSAGTGRWRLYADLMGGEAVVRLVLFAVVALVLLGRPSLLGLEIAVAAAALTWVLFLVLSPQARRTASFRVDYTGTALLWRRLSAMFTAACTAVLVTMYPVFIDAAAGSVDAITVSSTQIALQLTRAPIMIPLQALQGVAIASFVAQQDRPFQALAGPISKIMGLAVLGAIGAALLGPWILHLINDRYHVAPLWFGGLVLTAGVVAALTLTGTAALAADRHVDYAAGWLVAGAVGIAALWLPGELGQRVVVALLLGPALGVGVHLLLLLRHARRLPARVGSAP